MKKALLLSLVLGLGLSSAGVMAKEWKQIKLASEGAYPPFNELAADGSLRGFDIDIGNALCEQMKAKCTWVKQDWDGMIPALMARKFDAIVASMSMNAERKAKVDFTDKYYASPLALIAKNGSPLKPELAALSGKKIAVQRSTVADQFATKFWEGKGPVIVRYAKQEEAYADLGVGRVDATWVDYWEGYGGFLTKPEGKNYAVMGERVSGKTKEERDIIGDGVGIAINKKNADLRDQMNKALAEIRANGKYEEIRKKYFSQDIY